MLDLILVGALLMDNQSLPNQEILLIDEKMSELIGVCSNDSNKACATGADGEFRFNISEQNRPVKARVLVKLKDEIVTVVEKLIDIPQENPVEISVDRPKDLLTVDVTIESSDGFPDTLNVFIDPVKIDGVPEQLERFFKQVRDGVFDAHFVEKRIQGKTFSFKVKPGIYRIGGEYIIYERPMMVNSNFKNYIVDRVTLQSGNTNLTGNPYSGFTLNVDSDCKIVLSLRVVEDQELLK
jgi:hypothetical protein